MDRLRVVVDELVGLDPMVVADGESVVALSRELARLEAVVCRQVATFDRRGGWAAAGAQNAAAWVTTVCRVDRSEARRRVRLGNLLRVMDVVARAWLAGAITGRHVEVLARARDRSKLAAVAFGRDEARLVGWASTFAFHRFKQRVEEWLVAVDAEAAEGHAERQREGRRLHLSQSLDGLWFADGVLDPVAGEVVHDALVAITEELFDEDWRVASEELGAKPTGAERAELTRTPAQRRADAWVEMARRARAVPTGARQPAPLFTVLVGEESFARTCELASGTVITPGSLVPWLSESVVERIVFGGPDRVLSVSHQRGFTGAMRRALEVRDRVCGHPMCDRPAVFCEGDHLVPHALGGPTALENGRLLCGFHNRLRNESIGGKTGAVSRTPVAAVR